MKALLKLAMITCVLGSALCAQPPAKPEVQKTDSQDQASKPPEEPTLYKLHFVIYELEDGKRINEREYTFLDRVGEHSSIRTGTRMPISTGENKIEYLDVGLSLSCGLREHNGKLLADFNLNISSFAPTDNAVPHSGDSPVLRNFNQNVSAFLITGKPMLLASTDDLNSKRRTQLEVTATRVD
jgi:hypothetical protein